MNVTEVQSFLGFTGYSRWFIPKFMQVAQPLHALISGESAGKKKAAIVWNASCQWSFDDLKCLCITVPILAYADLIRPFELHANACQSCLGAVLYQTDNYGMDAVISYASRNLTKAKSYYLAHKLEFLALKAAAVEKFHEYPYGSTFDVFADNNPLTYVMTATKLTAASHCWVASLANYNFQLYYWVGKTNINVDALLGVSWLGCMPDTSDTHVQVTVAAV